MIHNAPPYTADMGGGKQLLRLVAKTSLIIMIAILFNSSLSIAEEPITPTETQVKPVGSAETDISVWLPEGAVDEPFTATADYVAAADLPEDIAYPPFTIGQGFTFGLWLGDGTTIRQFPTSIVISARYQESDVEVLPETRPEEEQLHLMMYDPATLAWLKLCGSVDIHENVVSAALSFPTPTDGKGSSLLALALDSTPPLTQTVDANGTTTLSVEGSNLGFQVLVDTIEDGANFEITPLSGTASSSSTVELFSNPVDIKGCQIDQDNPAQKNRQLKVYSKPLRVGFGYDSDTLSRAGGRSNLTIVNLKNGLWLDEEALGSRVLREDDAITVDTLNLGTFGMAAR